MRFDEQIIPPMCRLSHKFIDAQLFGHLENMMNLLVALKSGRWQQLPQDEKAIWLRNMLGLLGREAIDSLDWRDPDLLEILDVLESAIRAVRG